MNKKVLCVVLGVMSATAMASDYRVAYSGKEDLGIFVDNATEATWCQPQLNFRLQGGANTGSGSVEQLFPKIGKLLNSLCPSAETLTWRYIDQHQQVQMTGKTNKQEGWKYIPDQVIANEATDPTHATDTVSATEEAVPATTNENAPVATTEATEVTNPETLSTATVPEDNAIPAETSSANKETASTDHVEPVPAETRDYLSLEQFKVANWMPPTEQERQELIEPLVIKQNQEGCKMLGRFDFKGQENYIQIKTQGIQCDKKGFLNGEGSIRIDRTDGASILRDSAITLSHGLLFTEAYQHLSPESIVYVKDKSYIFAVGSDKALNSHYLLGAKIGFYHGLGVFNVDKGYVLVDNIEDFKHADRINTRIKAALAHFDKVIAPTESNFELLFVDDLQQVTNEYNTDGRVYKLSFEKKTKWNGHRTMPVGPWLIRDYTVKNYVFDREARAAEEKARQQAEQHRQEMIAKQEKAREQAYWLEQYENMQTQDFSTPDKIQAYVYKNVSYDSSDYRDLLTGSSQPISSLVHIDKVTDNDAISDWPYQMRITTSSPIKEGWYLMRGTQELNFDQKDSDGLPLTVVTVSSEGMYACQQDKCADLKDPLVMMRVLYGVGDWSPEHARKIINEAK